MFLSFTAEVKLHEKARSLIIIPKKPKKSAEEIHANVQTARETCEADPADQASKYMLAHAQYCLTKYVRVDNTPENAEYLGYISARELYPDFTFMKFADFVDDLIACKGQRMYPHIQR